MPNAPTEPQRLSDLLPTPTATETTTRSESSTFRTPSEVAVARNAGIERRIATGFALRNGLLVKGTGRGKVELRPTSLIPSRSGEPDFEPHRDAFATRLGAECVGPNRYRVSSGLLLDANGACRCATECPECGSEPVVRDQSGALIGGGEYRWRVPLAGQPGRFTVCSRCVTDDELRAAEAAHMAALAVSSRAGGRRS